MASTRKKHLVLILAWANWKSAMSIYQYSVSIIESHTLSESLLIQNQIKIRLIVLMVHP